MTLVLFLLILSVLVFVHEFGHFLMAKRNGILVEEFGFGLPPRIWSKKIGETVYSINLLPIGGFVKLFGEEGEEPARHVPLSGTGVAGRAFFEKSIPQRVTVIIAGVVMNFFLAVLVFSIIYSISGIPTKTDEVKIVGITKDSPAEMAGLKIDDRVISLDSQRIINVEEFIKLTKEKAGKVVRLEIIRDKDNPCQLNQQVLGGGAGPGFGFSCEGGNLLVAIIPRVEPPVGQGPLGVAISDFEMKRYPTWQMPFYGVREGLKESLAWGKMILGSLGEMFRNFIFLHQVPKDVAGPIGIYQATGMVAKSGILAVLDFLGILSVNLAIINILPFPALDGGRLLFLGIEAFLGKKVAPKIEAWINNLGMVILLFLVLLITINDIVRILAANNILEKISQMAF